MQGVLVGIVVEMSFGSMRTVGCVGRCVGQISFGLWFLLPLGLVVVGLVATHLVVLMEVCLVVLAKVVVELGSVGCCGLH